MVEPAPLTSGSPTGRFVGLILISVGVLWLSLTGLCTAFAFLSLIGTADYGDILLILTVAVPSAVIGGAIYFVGRLLRPRA
jgi:hypothetical protein